MSANWEMHVQDEEAKKRVFESRGLRVSNPLGWHPQTVPINNSVFFWYCWILLIFPSFLALDYNSLLSGYAEKDRYQKPLYARHPMVKFAWTTANYKDTVCFNLTLGSCFLSLPFRSWRKDTYSNKFQLCWFTAGLALRPKEHILLFYSPDRTCIGCSTLSSKLLLYADSVHQPQLEFRRKGNVEILFAVVHRIPQNQSEAESSSTW